MYPIALMHLFKTSILSIWVLLNLLYLEHVKCEDSNERNPYSVILEHACGSNEFVKRGTITIKNIRSGFGVYQQDGPLGSDTLQVLKGCAQSNSLYKVRVPSNGLSSQYVSSFVRASDIVGSSLSDVITLTVDPSNPSIILGIKITAIKPSEETNEELDKFFTTAIEIRQIGNGPIPDTASYIQKIEQEKLAKERGETKDNRSLLAKYWMYIIPIVIFMAFSSTANPDNGSASSSR